MNNCEQPLVGTLSLDILIFKPDVNLSGLHFYFVIYCAKFKEYVIVWRCFFLLFSDNQCLMGGAVQAGNLRSAKPDYLRLSDE